jgi:autotransporter translocation and assembly factor TamB
LKTDLLDEALRLNFKLLIDQGELKNGFVDILPLKTTVFKRPIEVPSAKIKFHAPLEPTMDAGIIFKLPEYTITMLLEGPLSKPRYAFSSEPPLPQNDIYAVLLFGRPIAELDPDSKNAAQRTNMMLTQGILSLSVLYFLAGSPVEYVGYDPQSGEASAQIGLGAKTSLRVGAGESGSTSTGVRRSLGKGWYLDTSVQNNQNTSTSDTKDYGVLLERVIAY